MITSKGAYFIADTQVRPPERQELAEVARAANPCSALQYQTKVASVYIPTSAVTNRSSARCRHATALLKASIRDRGGCEMRAIRVSRPPNLISAVELEGDQYAYHANLDSAMSPIR